MTKFYLGVIRNFDPSKILVLDEEADKPDALQDVEQREELRVAILEQEMRGQTREPKGGSHPPRLILVGHDLGSNLLSYRRTLLLLLD